LVRKTKEEALETRHRILDAAEAVFEARGVGNTSLAEIATAAGVTRGAIYWHFANKVDLFDAMLQRLFDPLEAKLAEVREQPHANPLDALRQLAFYFIDRVANDPRYARVLGVAWHKCEYVGDMAKIRDNHVECGNRHLEIIEQGFRMASERGFAAASLDARCAAVGLMAIVDGLVVNWTLDPHLFPLASFGPSVVDHYLAGVSAGA
jgi:TetR/AcrR family transcriptional regulator, acrAB operon repressor